MSEASSADRRWLDAAVRLATPYLGTTAESATVGTLVVEPATGVLLGRAVTARGGSPHAALKVLQAVGEAARGATLYTTLEPCGHWDRTPPCADEILRAGIARVVIGVPAPGGDESIVRMREAGLDVIVAGHAPSQRLHRGFVLRVTESRPFVVLRLAVSADGKIGAPDGGRIAITGDIAGRWTYMQRARADAVLIGGATAEIDDPRLLVRLKGLEDRTALRVILSGAQLNTSVNLIASLSGYPIAILSTIDTVPDVPASVEVITVEGTGGHPDLRASLAALSKKGISTLFVEGGARTTEAFLAAGLVDRFHLLSSEIIVGDSGISATHAASIEVRLADAGLVEVDRRELGDDLLRSYERQEFT